MVSKQTTLGDVAAAAGVSRATVSRVINRSKYVDPAVAQRVQQAVDQLGYVPNQAARSLSRRRTDMVAMVVGEPGERFFHDPFIASVIRGVSAELSTVDMRMVMSMIQTADEGSRLRTYLLGRPVDGVLVISEHGTRQVARDVAAAGIPVVVGGRPMLTDSDTLPYVDSANRKGARLGTEHLRSLGCRRLATITGPPDMTAGIDRLLGFRDAARDATADCITEGDFTIAGGRAAMERILGRCADVDGVFAASDLMALGAIQALQSRGKQVPDDVAVVGFDDIDMAASAAVPLTTVRQDSTLQGRMMVRLLMQHLGREGDLGRAARDTLPAAGSIVLPVTLVKRASA